MHTYVQSLVYLTSYVLIVYFVNNITSNVSIHMGRSKGKAGMHLKQIFGLNVQLSLFYI